MLGAFFCFEEARDIVSLVESRPSESTHIVFQTLAILQDLPKGLNQGLNFFFKNLLSRFRLLDEFIVV